MYAASVIVTSDTCCLDPKADTSGQYVVDRLRELNFSNVNKHVVSDDKYSITSLVKRVSQDNDNVLTVTVGGTGLCPRDVTPEATSVLYEKHCNGISTALLMASLRSSPHAALSRMTAGIYSDCLIVNFPGKLKACQECLACLEEFLVHALEQVKFDADAIKATHETQARSQIVDAASTTDLGRNSSSAVLEPTLCSKIASNLSPYPMIEFDKALEILAHHSTHLFREQVVATVNSDETAQAVIGDVLAEDHQSRVCVPPSDVSTVDGYVVNIPEPFIDSLPCETSAIILEDLIQFEKQLLEHAHDSFFCYPVNTGEKLPSEHVNALFSIVPIERTERVGPSRLEFRPFLDQPKVGQYVRRVGSDLSLSDSLKAGTTVGPIELSLLLSMGHKSLTVFKKPIIGILSTGDELVDCYVAGSTPGTKVVDTNKLLLTMLFDSKGFKVRDFGISKDEAEEVLLNICDSLKECDILVITGGSSMGFKDYVKSVITGPLGGRIHFGRINMKPGKPAAFASIGSGATHKFIFALPGNPVSAYITSMMLVIPFLEQGRRNHSREELLTLTVSDLGDLITVRIEAIVDSDGMTDYVFDGRTEFVRARLSSNRDRGFNAQYSATVSLKQQSSRLMSLKDCDCLILVNSNLRGSKFLVGQTYPALKLKS